MTETRTATEDLTSLQRAARAVVELRARLEAAERSRNEPIAIVGLDVRFPGSSRSAEAFWDFLESGRDGVGPVPADRWDAERFYDPVPRTPGKAYCREGGFIDGVDRFDAAFFGIAAREADSMDPQHRLLLETSWRALEHAGIAPDSLAEAPVGVFVGLCSNDYEMLTLNAGAADAFFLPGTRPHAAAGRISHTLGLRGPSMVFDTACSSSLLAVHAACQSLRADECTTALAGGVNLILIPDGTVILSQAEMLSADGRCKTCDAAGDGYGRSEGCGVAVLKRLSRAQAGGDRILAVILGSAVNHDGASGGMTVPSAVAQQQVIARALENAGVEAADVGFIEMHGTGTPLGDPIEVRALAAVHAGARPADDPLAIGAVKSNVGHLEGAAGIAALSKVVGCLHRGRIMGNLHFGTPNPAIDWDAIPVRLAAATREWTVAPGKRRIAGVSAFGASGTNVHMIIAEGPAATSPPVGDAGPAEATLLVLSSNDDDGLRRQAEKWADWLESLDPAVWHDAAARAAVGRAHRACRLALVADSAAVAAGRLRAFLAGAPDAGVHVGRADGAKRYVGLRAPAVSSAGPDTDILGLLRQWGLDVDPAAGDAADFDYVLDLADAGTGDRPRLLDAVGRAFVAGCLPDWRAVHAPRPHRWVDVPLTTFAGPRHWIRIPETAAAREIPAAVAEPTPLARLFERQIEETAEALNDIVRRQLDHVRAVHSAASPPARRVDAFRHPAEWQMVPISASDGPALDAELAAFARALKAEPAAAWAVRAGQPAADGQEAVVVVARDGAEARLLLAGDAKSANARLYRGRRPATPQRAAFLLSGIGDHYPGLARGLMERWPSFRETVEYCLARLDPALSAALKGMMAGSSAPSGGAKPNLKTMLGRDRPTATPQVAGPPVAHVHPLVFVVEYALARLLMSFGIEPAAMVGYSLGDYVAAVISGVMSLDDALVVVAARARLMDGAEAGGMLAVPMAAAELAPRQPAGVALAVSATPDLSIVAGPPDGLTALAASLDELGVLCRRLQVSRAFHTAALAGIAEPLAEVLRSIRLNPPERPFVSGATGDWITVEEAVDPGFWVRHSLTPVRFSEALATLFAAGHHRLVEVGPGNSLTSFAIQHGDAEGGNLTAVAAMRSADDPQSDAGALLGAVARLWLSGIDVKWQRIMVGLAAAA